MTAAVYLLSVAVGLFTWLILYRPVGHLPDFHRPRTVRLPPSTLALRLQQIPLLRDWRPATFVKAQLLTALLAALAYGAPQLVAGEGLSPGLLIAAGFGFLVWPLGLYLALRRRRQAMGLAFYDLLDHLVLQTRTGVTPLQALQTAPRVVREPLRSELETLVIDLHVRPMQAALADLALRTGNPEIQAFATSVAQQARSGHDLSSVWATQQSLQQARAREQALIRVRQAANFVAIAIPIIVTNALLLAGVLLYARWTTSF